MSEEVMDKHHLQPADARFGMWLFLFTELMLFGGLFLLYSLYRYRYAFFFKEASTHLNIAAGATNTVILLTSSLTVVFALESLKLKRKALTFFFIASTIALALSFLTVKYFEWSAKIAAGIYPGSEKLLLEAPGVNMFFGLYYLMTGLHGIHVIVGIFVFLFAMSKVARRLPDESHLFLENSGLYWHLVDIIWIFLFPFFYLV